ncbi:MAG: serpin family protein [Alphaproteobacteria bacterium]|nr:serpin family protein [Alphaproteobacteria bacterium]
MTRASLALILLAGCYQGREITELSPEMTAVVAGNNAFAVDVYSQIAAEDDGNLFLSPFSMSAALGMTMAGAETTTLEEMRAVLQVGLDDGLFHENFGALMRDLSGHHRGRPYQLAVANRLFGQQGMSWKAPFMGVCTDDYDAPLQEMDYVGDAEGARHDINAWVADQTEDKIEELLGAGSIDASTRMVLVNAIYFKADWASQFEESNTAPLPFTLASGEEIDVPTMQQTVEASVYSDAAVSVLRLPYETDELSMIIALPAEPDGVADLEAGLSAEQVDAWLDGMDEGGDVAVKLPRFEMRYELSLKETLSAMGMPSAFDPDTVDLSGMTDDAALVVDDVIHEAYVKVDEEGTEAAAATAVVTREMSASIPAEFFAQHPFVFFIRDDVTGSILFMGRVADPSLPAAEG